MAYRKNHKTFSESRKKKKRTKRSRQVFRQKLFQCTVMMGSVVFLSAAAFQKISDGQTNKAENISKEGAEAKTAAETEVNEETEEPFINILEAESSEMTITWDAAFSRR